MKKQKTACMAWILLFLFAASLQSCLDDSDNEDSPLFAIGTVKVIEGKNYYFALDEGSKLYPGDTTAIRNYAVVDGQRAFVYFNKLDEVMKGYDYNARIIHIENVLTKDIYFMPAEKNDSIGDDRINATNFWITGNYLNIKYQFYHSNHASKKHMLNLIVAQTTADDNNRQDYVNLEFRHNAYDDSQSILGTGLVSFKLNNISDLLKEKKGLSIRIKSLYDGERIVTINYPNKQRK